MISEFAKDVNTVQYIVGHNITSDIKRVIDNLQKYNIKIIKNNKDYEIFDSKTIKCTMNLGKTVCALKNKTGNIKPPKLCELFSSLFNEDMKNAHDALYDVKCTSRCYFKLLELAQI